MEVREYVFAVFPIYRLGTCTVCLISQWSEIIQTFGCKFAIYPLPFRLDSMKELHKANRQQYEKHQQSREDSTKAIERLEGSSGGIGEQYKFLQEMRGYV